MASVVMRNVIMLNVVMLNDVMLSAVAPVWHSRWLGYLSQTCKSLPRQGNGHHDIQHNDNQHNNTQHNSKLDKTLSIMLLSWVSFMLSIANKPIMLSVVMLNVVMLSVAVLNVMAPGNEPVIFNYFLFFSNSSTDWHLCLYLWPVL